MTVLVVTYGVPYPPDGGSRIRNLNTIRWLARRHTVLLLSLTWDADEARHLPELRRHCDHVDMVVNHRSRAATLAALAGISLAGRPLGIYPYDFPAMAAKVREVAGRWRPDVAVFEQIYVAPYVDALPADARRRCVLSLHDVASSQYRSLVPLPRDPLRRLREVLWWRLMCRVERHYVGRFDRCVVVSARDADLLRRRHRTPPLAVVENGVDTSGVRPGPDPARGNDILFVGDMSYLPNADGVRHFVDTVLPRVRSAVPDATLHVVGHRPAVPASDHVVVTGRIAELTPLYDAARVVIAPLRGGGGTRLKILEAMAHGRAVVSTSVGCEGLDVRDREHLLIADTPARFAADVIELLTSPELRRRVAGNARRFVEARHDWSIVDRQLAAVYGDPGEDVG
jgi:glycosyltransferase involved in cell wall biosynthesis